MRKLFAPLSFDPHKLNRMRRREAARRAAGRWDGCGDYLRASLAGWLNYAKQRRMEDALRTFAIELKPKRSHHKHKEAA